MTDLVILAVKDMRIRVFPHLVVLLFLDAFLVFPAALCIELDLTAGVELTDLGD